MQRMLHGEDGSCNLTPLCTILTSGTNIDAVCKTNVDASGGLDVVVVCDAPLKGQFVTIYSPTWMVLCEAEVYTDEIQAIEGTWRVGTDAIGHVQCCSDSGASECSRLDASQGCLSDAKSPGKTHQSAVNSCVAQGMRLCTIQELNERATSCCAQNKCGHNTNLVWTINARPAQRGLEMMRHSTSVDSATGQSMFEITVKRPLKGESNLHYEFNQLGGTIHVIAARGRNDKEGEHYTGNCGTGAGYGCYHGAQQKTRESLIVARPLSQCVCRNDCKSPSKTNHPPTNVNQAAITTVQANQATTDATRVNKAVIDAAKDKFDEANKKFEAAGCAQNVSRVGCDALQNQVNDAKRELTEVTQAANGNVINITTTVQGGGNDVDSSTGSSSVDIIVVVCVVVSTVCRFTFANAQHTCWCANLWKNVLFQTLHRHLHVRSFGPLVQGTVLTYLHACNLHPPNA